jgi:checkpoint serine/threonine-protein kinase
MDNERQQFLHEIAALDLEQDEDPLATYWRYIQWINRNFPPERAQESGLVDVLEDATKLFLEDDLFKTDLRYLKIWVLYARHVDDPAVVYAHLLSKNIGTTYALLYEEYADLLEKSGK